MPECPNCERGFKGSTCKRCGWSREPGPGAADSKRLAWKTECEWMTAGRRCLIRPSAMLDGGRQYCSWHHAVALSGAPRSADHVESYEAYVLDLETRHVCMMETHYPVRITFAWVCGEPLSAKPTPCASETCAVRRRDEEPLPPLPPSQGRQVVAELQARLGAKLGAIPPIDPAIRAILTHPSRKETR